MKGSPMSTLRQTCNNNYFFNNPSTKKGYEAFIYITMTFNSAALGILGLYELQSTQNGRKMIWSENQYLSNFYPNFQVRSF